jgi:hypothetical protein
MSETAAYIAGRIRAAGGVGAQVFTREAVGIIHEHARGIPRTISVIADNALLSGFATGQRPVGSTLVREVCRDFRIETEPSNARPQIVEPVTPVVAPSEATTRPGRRQHRRPHVSVSSIASIGQRAQVDRSVRGNGMSSAKKCSWRAAQARRVSFFGSR